MIYKSIKTRKMAKYGKMTAIKDNPTDAVVSTVDTIGFATPPVVVVEAKRVTPEDPATAAAVPPPAIIANAHVITGLKSATVETITAVPATAANGIAIESNALST